MDKLGIKPAMRVIIMHAPPGYLDLMPTLADDATLVSRLGGRFDVIQYFVTSVQQLNAVMPNLALHLEPGGMLWISWAKKSSPESRNLTDVVVRKAGIEAGLVDVKVASVTDDWSALKFVYRVADR
jgi:hypothetical protein